MVRYLFIILTCVLFHCGCCHLEKRTNYFPAGIFNENDYNDNFQAEWYGRNLKALKEFSLYENKDKQNKQVYRFLWLRTFNQPVAIRLEIAKGDGAGLLYVKASDGFTGGDPGKLVQDYVKKIGPKEILLFFNLLKEEGYWNIKPMDSAQAGFDGSRWIIEAVNGRSYHLVDRWSPKDGPVRKIGLFLLSLSGLNLIGEEIY